MLAMDGIVKKHQQQYYLRQRGLLPCLPLQAGHCYVFSGSLLCPGNAENKHRKVARDGGVARTWVSVCAKNGQQD